jgi:NtrC-family two-component system response regulator AlgB
MDALKVLLVDDDKNIRQTLRVSLKSLGCEVETSENAEEALRLLRQNEGVPFDFMLTDYKLTGKSGVELILDCKRLAKPPVIVVMTAYASFENAVNAIQAGAFDYLPKPFSNVQLGHVLSKVRTLVELRHENERLKKGEGRSDFFEGMISPAMQRLEEFVTRVAPTDATVLLTGESGTGKSELARVIHLRSARAQKPFVIVNCATLTESLLESELFGHVKGAFTGAVHDHMGKLESARGGTLLIDEIGELSSSAQTRLLRFLQERVIERVGANRSIEIDVRVIAATNRNLEEAVESGGFREDLYYRLNVFECAVVPLRYRKEDLPILIQRFLKEFTARAGLSKIQLLSEAVMKVLLDYSWPGNVRELRNVMERTVLLSSGREISVEDLPEAVRKGPGRRETLSGQSGVLRSIDEVVREHISRVLEIEPNQERAAEILGITTVTLWRKRKEYGLP